MASESPFKFLDSYHKEDKDIFFGRETEVEEVYNKVFQGKTLFIYGESGTGKSSLINCGLANRFDDEDWLPVNVRRGRNINESVIRELSRLAITEVQNLNGSFSANLDAYTRSIYLDYFKPVYFIFDQFEELYLLGNRSEWNEFIAGIKALASTDLFVHFIFIIRSEYLHFMAEFEDEFMEIFANKLRIEKITRAQAIDCIEGPCKVAGITLEDDFAENLLHRLSPDKTEIELTYLQVFLDRIFREASAKANGQGIVFANSVLDNLGKIGDVLSDFLDQQITSFSNSDNALAVLKSFVTLEGTKKQLSFEEIEAFVQSLGFKISATEINEIVNELVNKRILKDKDDNDRYELRHDSLALKIFEKITLYEKELIEVGQFIDYGYKEYERRSFLLNESDLAYIEPYESKLSLSQPVKDFIARSKQVVRRKKRSRTNIIIIGSVIVVLLISSLVLLAYSLRQKEIAEEYASIANRESEVARQERQAADDQRQIAETNAELAQEQALRAEQQSQIANRERQRADVARLDAESQRRQAVAERQNAVTAQQRAEASALEAVEQRNNAEQQRLAAERLRILSLANALGAKSIQARDGIEKAFMAAQAYRFNVDYSGYPLQNEVFNGLYQSVRFQSSPDFNAIQHHADELRGLSLISSGIVSVDVGGHFVTHTISGGQFTIQQEYVLPGASNDFESTTSTVIHGTLHLGNHYFVGTEDGRLIIVDIEEGRTRQNLQLLPSDDGFWELAHNSNVGELVAITFQGNILSWNLAEVVSGTSPPSQLVYQNDTSNLRINDLAVRASGDIFFNEGGTLLRLGEHRSLQQGPETIMPGVSGSEITQLEISPDEKVLAVGYKDGSIQLVQVDEKRLLASLAGHSTQVSDMAFHPQGTLLASASYDKSLKIWNLEDLAVLPTVIDDFESWLLATTFTEDGSALLTGEANGKIRNFTLEMEEYYDLLCGFLGRNMTNEEWGLIVGEDFTYTETCQIEDE